MIMTTKFWVKLILPIIMGPISQLVPLAGIRSELFSPVAQLFPSL